MNFGRFYNSDPSPTDPKCWLCEAVLAVRRRRDVRVDFAVAESVHTDTDGVGVVIGMRELEEQEPVEVSVWVQNDLARGNRFHIAAWNGEENQ